MKRILLVALAVLVVPLAGIWGWQYVRSRQAESQAQAHADWASQQKMVSVEFVVAAPQGTPADQTLYLSGSAPTLGNWDAAGLPLERGADGKYRGKAELMSGVEHSFKVTRGTWGTVEKGAGGEELPNRAVTGKEGGTVEVQVAMWVDEGKSIPGRITMTGDIRLHKKFKSNLLGNERNLIVYLPPGYDQNEEARYPVLYLHDGQNLMDASTSYAGIEWGVDEAAQKLIGEGKIRPAIVVGIYNTEQRTQEFTPPALAPNGGSGSQQARGDLYARHVVEEVKPFIDRVYRTSPAREDTAIGGSSMGGLVTLFIVQQNPETFGQVVLLSPWLRVNNQLVQSTLMGDGGWLKGKRVFIDMGTKPGKNYPGDNAVADAREMVQRLDAAGLKRGADYQYTEVEGDRHGESDWAKRIDQVLMFLFAK